MISTMFFVIFIFSIFYISSGSLLTPKLNETISFEPNWFNASLFPEIHQVAGIAVRNEDSMVTIFHRGKVIWDASSFDNQNNYLKVQNGPITLDTVINLDPQNGKILNSWGSNLFFLPHGISYGDGGSVWVTDVALHQVLRFDAGQLKIPSLTLGTRFVHGNDEHHFCKPTDVKVSNYSNLVFISDGYCNQRIVVINKEGKFIKSIGLQENIFVSHSLALFDKLDLICVADRENQRILCFNAGNFNITNLGKIERRIYPNLGSIYAIDSLDSHRLIGVAVEYSDKTSIGFIVDLQDDSVLETWNSTPSFIMPHDLAVDHNLNTFYVSEIDLKTQLKVFKFKIKENKSNFKKSTEKKIFTDENRIKIELNKKKEFFFNFIIFIIFLTIFGILCIFYLKNARKNRHTMTIELKNIFQPEKNFRFHRLPPNEETCDLISNDSETD